MQITITCYNKFIRNNGSNRREGIKFIKKDRKRFIKEEDEGGQ